MMNDICNPNKAYNELVKPTDGPISRYFNRRISIRITCFLINHNIKPQPNTITLLTTLIGLLTAITTYLNPLIGGFLVEITSILDGIDGEIARLTGKVSRYGAFLDAMLDRIVDISILTTGSLYLLDILEPKSALIIASWLISSSILVSYLHARGEASLNTNLQLLGFRIYAGRDVRLFLYSIALILYVFQPLIYLSLTIIIALLSTIYIFCKIIVARKL
ncbi:MAG: CDP-alcohol phosphatidyltransferase [Desulfurococcales archaeon ex4484_58]|nr:MAG: CDP-alcohol phosphatidyltransferase [Desulfurococcales archaeon ex4484_58]